MIQSDLPHPGKIANAGKLRLEVNKAISAVERLSEMSGGTSKAAEDLQAFFAQCVVILDDYVEIAPGAPITPPQQ